MKTVMNARRGIGSVAIGVAVIAVAAAAHAHKPAATTESAASSDADYIANMMTAAPEVSVKGATIVTMSKDGKMVPIQKGTNEFTCMLVNGTPKSGHSMCADKNAMEWVKAMSAHKAPPDKVGFMYGLNGDGGTSNTDPYATKATPDNHWMNTGAHVIVLGPASKTFGYTRAPDADPTKPRMMWVGTPYEHAMIPMVPVK